VQNAAIGGVLFYLASYAIMNTGAFGILMMLPSRSPRFTGQVSLSGGQPTETASTGTSAETFEDLAGQGRKHLTLGIAMAVCCWSLTGLPFTIGFFGKLFLIKPALGAAKGEVATRMIWLVVLLVINAAISAAYYLKIIATMFLRPEPAPFASPKTQIVEPEPIGRPWPIMAGITLSVIGTILFGIYLPATNHLWERSRTAEAVQVDRAATTQPVANAR